MSPLRKRPQRRPGSAAPPPLPEVRQEVDLALPGRERFAARVTQVSDEAIVLVLMLDARDPLQLGEVAEMALEFAGPRGLVRIEGQGRVTAYDVVHLRLEGAVEVVQRRDFVRVRAVRPMALAPIDEEGTIGDWIDTLTVNVSGNGFLAAGPDTLAIGSAVRFRVRVVEGEPPIEGLGRVARASDAGHRGIAIEQLVDDGRRRLVAFIFERERIARRVTRDSEL
ncbi:PilZ domain-containing protein [Conexibacter woesei]|uniref:Type IV pilus assembly PilZ n=1 Tax=Conexibacter woesei (strain DSM 14684 / CCUG 47730 / CIP 108061 / JCM 11494 / NBRC 100937 / ID131577) TaxID=469383 RepID=D3F425_CONWI|nr:PilZ domain-containing protein [Conexibacter woesei]ADB48508.1 type IV pilus assembly PilZ [Conexibacter woesei DSM 14684]